MGSWLAAGLERRPSLCEVGSKLENNQDEHSLRLLLLWRTPPYRHLVHLDAETHPMMLQTVQLEDNNRSMVDSLCLNEAPPL